MLAALQAVAADPQSTNVVASANTPSTSKTQVQVQKAQVQPTYPAVQFKLESKKQAAKDQDKIVRYKGLSSQAWTTIAMRQSDPSVFQNAKVHEANFCLFSLGHKAW